MVSILAFIFGVMMLCPYIVFILYVIYRGRRSRIDTTVAHQAADWTTLFLLLSILTIGQTIFQASIFFYVLVIILIVALTIATIERFRVKDFEISTVLKKIWRVLFLLSSVAYFLLLLIGLMFNIVQQFNS